MWQCLDSCVWMLEDIKWREEFQKCKDVVHCKIAAVKIACVDHNISRRMIIPIVVEHAGSDIVHVCNAAAREGIWLLETLFLIFVHLRTSFSAWSLLIAGICFDGIETPVWTFYGIVFLLRPPSDWKRFGDGDGKRSSQQQHTSFMKLAIRLHYNNQSWHLVCIVMMQIGFGL